MIIVMLNEVKHLDEIPMNRYEMLHVIQHDMTSMADRVTVLLTSAESVVHWAVTTPIRHIRSRPVLAIPHYVLPFPISRHTARLRGLFACDRREQ